MNAMSSWNHLLRMQRFGGIMRGWASLFGQRGMHMQQHVREVKSAIRIRLVTTTI